MRGRGLWGALAGVLSAATALGVGELVAVFVRPAASPLIAVGNALILLTPEDAKQTAIQSVGTNDKPLLIIGILVMMAVFGAMVGDLAVRRLWYGLVGIAVFAAFGVFCALYANASQGTDVIPTLVGAIAAAAVLVVLVRLLDRAEIGASEPNPARRTFLVGGAGAAALAAVTGFGGRAWQHARFDVEDERRSVALPKPKDISVVPRGADLGKSGLPWATESGEFYRIDTALSVPQISPKDWQLRIHGMVDKPMTLTYDQVLARPMIERWITLCCVSNPIGGNLVGNAYWQGTKLADLLREAGIHRDSDQLLLSSSDGMTIGAPTKVVMDGRDALLAVGMNGAPLPIAHGFPARIVVPGLYGYVSACKWIVDIKATTFKDDEAYWVRGGWVSGQLETGVKLMSRIDTPRSGRSVAVGRPVAIAGVAWDQHVGVSKVEVQVDDGEWLPARLATVPSTDTWRQWVLAWTPPRSGTYRLRVRATDARGRHQIQQPAGVFPSGATGWHTITVQASTNP